MAKSLRSTIATYREIERKRAVTLCQAIMRDPGNGIFLGKQRDFVLKEPALNLWEGIREDALVYFKENKIPWWKGQKDDPTGHLLSSQVACVNHLYALRQRSDLATAVLSAIDSTVVRALQIVDGFVEFEFIGATAHLNERSWTRGANCTSVDAAMMGESQDGKRKLFLIEWKYTELYEPRCLYNKTRSAAYDALISAPSSPFQRSVPVKAFYYEPFYQMMRQTLLGSLAAQAHDYGVIDYRHVHVIPFENTELLGNITSPEFSGTTITNAWRSVLCDPSKYVSITPELLLKPCQGMVDAQSHVRYLKKRYW